jgi:amidase
MFVLNHGDRNLRFGFGQAVIRYLICLALCLCAPVWARSVTMPRSIPELQEAMRADKLTSVDLVKHYLDRIHDLDRRGPHLGAVIAVNPEALADARALDAERHKQGPRGPLHGIPVLIKDNIETRDRMPTTAGSLLLALNFAAADAPVVGALRAAGAVILGKTNLSEWANFRSTRSTSGWSGVGGLTRNPFVLDRTSCGSSSGSAVAVAADLAAASLGTETDGSVTCPASMNGIVGLKPTVGLLSQRGIVPISHTQDTAGPMARSVPEVALLLTAMVAERAQCERGVADCHEADYVAALAKDALHGRRIGVLRFAAGSHPEMDAVYGHALDRLRSAGAILVEVKFPDSATIEKDEMRVLLAEFKADLKTYLAGAPSAVSMRTLNQLIEGNRTTPGELTLFGQELFIQAEETAGLSEPGYLSALEEARRLAREGIDQLLAKEHLDLLVAPTTSPAWRVDLLSGDSRSGDSYTTLPAVAGYPHLTVPMGQVQGLPVGLSFIGTAWSEPQLLAAGNAFSQQGAVFSPPRFRPSVDDSMLAPATARDDGKE